MGAGGWGGGGRLNRSRTRDRGPGVREKPLADQGDRVLPPSTMSIFKLQGKDVVCCIPTL